MADIRIGISGWTYPPWRGVFFPQGLTQKSELAYASRQVSSIEINGTFYSLQTPSSYAKWARETPGDFIFSVKGPRFITHIRRLKEPTIPLANFFASGVLRLGSKLGPILWQLPPSLQFNRERLAEFFTLLPRSTRAAEALADKHDQKVKAVWTKADADRPLRHALEVRHHSFQTPEFITLLRRHRIALVIADTAGKWPFMEDVTADFIYIRLHGDEELYVSGYTARALEEWRRKIAAWSRGQIPAHTKLTAVAAKSRAAGRDVFVYFDNDVKIRAPYDAMSLRHALGLGPNPPPFPRKVRTVTLTPRTIWPSYPTTKNPARRPAERLAPRPAPNAPREQSRRRRTVATTAAR